MRETKRNDKQKETLENYTSDNAKDNVIQEAKKKEQQKKGWFRNFGRAMHMELREHKSSFFVYFVLRILVIAMMVLQVLNRNYENVLLCALTLLLLVIPSFVQVTFKIELPTTLEIIILVFIFAAEILGGNQRILPGVPLLGHGPAHAERISGGGNRVLPGGFAEPQ